MGSGVGGGGQGPTVSFINGGAGGGGGGVYSQSVLLKRTALVARALTAIGAALFFLRQHTTFHIIF